MQDFYRRYGHIFHTKYKKDEELLKNRAINAFDYFLS